MKNKNIEIMMTVIILIVFLFAGCSSKEVISTLENEVEDLNKEINDLNIKNDDLEERIKVFQAMPTITPTMAPTPTPAPTPELTPNDHIQNIFNRFLEASLAVDDIVIYDENTDPNGILGRPTKYIAKGSFLYPGCDDEYAGTIEIFANKDDLDTREKYLDEIYDIYPLNRKYMYKIGLALFRLNFDVVPSEAEKYEEIFNSYWD